MSSTKSTSPNSVVQGIPRLGLKPAGWREVAFGDVLDVVKRRAKIEPDQEYQLINVRRNRGGVVPRGMKPGREIKTNTQFYVAANDFLISRRQIVHGACGVVPSELDGALVSNEYSTLVPKNGLCLDFLAYITHTSHFQKTCFHASVGVVIEKMIFKLDAWLDHRFYLPPLEEQERIVRILATADRVTARIEDLIAAKRRLKKGLAQQLLSEKFQMPDGSPEAWKQVRLADITTVILSGVDKKIRFAETKVRLCNYTDVYYGDRIGLDCDFKKATANNSEIEKYSLQRGDVIITKDSETPADIAKPAVVTEDMSDVLCGYHLAILRPKKVCGPFLAQLLRLPLIRHEFYRVANGVTRFGLAQAAIEGLAIKVPSREEQQRIATVLDCVDRHIELHQKRLSALRKIKKGFMQRLLGERYKRSRVSTWGELQCA